MMPTTARYACLDAREFPLQALLRLRPELQGKPVAVFDGEPRFEQVCSLNDPALTLGIVPGMTKMEMEMFPTAVVLQRSRTEEAAARTALLECAGTFSPRSILPAQKRYSARPMLWAKACGRRQRQSASMHRSRSAATFMPPGAWHGGIPARVSVWYRGAWNALHLPPCRSWCSIFLPSIRKPSPCGASRPLGHSATWRKQN
jgi:hypothetical protein